MRARCASQTAREAGSSLPTACASRSAASGRFGIVASSRSAASTRVGTRKRQSPQASAAPAPRASATDAAMTGYGWPDTKPFFWLIDDGNVGTNMHLAFTVDTRELVHAFYETAAGLDAQLLHPPATHPEYHEHYYGAFVLDPHGLNLEAVCHHDPT